MCASETDIVSDLYVGATVTVYSRGYAHQLRRRKDEPRGSKSERRFVIIGRTGRVEGRKSVAAMQGAGMTMWTCER